MKWVNNAVFMSGLMCLVFAALSCAPSPSATKSDAEGKNAGAENQKSGAVPDSVTVYYFHNTRRCGTCLGIQKGIEETIHTKFAKDLEAGLLVFEELNMEEDANKKYVKEFKLSFSSMVVAAKQDGKTVQFENAGKVWDFAHSENELKEYVEKSVQSYLDKLGTSI